MRDKRPVDELSIAELERILAIRKREARLERVRRYESRQVRSANGPRDLVAPINDAGIDAIEDGISEGPVPGVEGDETEALAPSARRAGSRAVPTDAPQPAPPAVYFDGEPSFEDELESRRLTANAAVNASAPPINLRRILNLALTLVEVAAAIGLVVLLVGLAQSFQDVSLKSAEVQAEFEATSRAGFIAPTATPLINLGAVVLPSGHRFENNQAVFNLDEVPTQYRDQYVAYIEALPRTRPTPSPEGPIRIRIPAINVDSVVVTGDDWESLKLGVGHHIGSANPGERGNLVLSGHNDVYGNVFRYLDQLSPGDQIIVSTRTRDYVYEIQPIVERGETRGHRIVNPTDTWVLGASGDVRQLTLISCYPFQVDNKRIVVVAHLVS